MLGKRSYEIGIISNEALVGQMDWCRYINNAQYNILLQAHTDFNPVDSLKETDWRWSNALFYGVFDRILFVLQIANTLLVGLRTLDRHRTNRKHFRWADEQWGHFHLPSIQKQINIFHTFFMDMSFTVICYSVSELGFLYWYVK